MIFFFYYETPTPEIYTLSLHDALPILARHSSLRTTFETRGDAPVQVVAPERRAEFTVTDIRHGELDRKSTRLNSSHTVISYAVFCLKKKKTSTPSRRIKNF